MNNLDSIYLQAKNEMGKDAPDLRVVQSLLEKGLHGGDMRAAYALGTWYLNGYYFEKDVKKGFDLIRQAASAMISDALYDMAVSYEEGIGVDKNLQLAAHYYLKAALRDDKQAVFEVGRCYFYGIGFLKDKEVADIWLDKAKDLGVFESLS